MENRKTDGAMEPFAGRDGASGEVRVAGDVGDPDRFGGCPDPSGKSHAGRERGSPARSFELLEAPAAAVPRFDAAQEICFRVNVPERTVIPAQRFTDGFQNPGRRFGESPARSQSPSDLVLRRQTALRLCEITAGYVQAALHV